MRYIQPVTETLRAMLALGWTIDPSGVCHEDDGTGLGFRRRQYMQSVRSVKNLFKRVGPETVYRIVKNRLLFIIN